MQDPLVNLDIDMVIDDARDNNDEPNINVAAAQEHIPEVERAIQVIKERYMSLWHKMAYKSMPIVMIQEAVITIVKLLNAFPPKGGLSTEYSPRIIMGMRPIDYKKHCKITFGSYCQASNENQPTNMLNPRTIGGTYLSALESAQVGQRLLDLATA